MEFIHVVPRARLFPEWAPHGFLAFGPEFEQASFLQTVQDHGFFVEREHAERDASLKQPIPYCVVVQDGKVLLLTRSKKGGEARLHNKLSIGVGGHVEPVDLPTPEELALRPDWSPRNPIPKAARREATEEELEVEGDHELQPVGLINDDSNPVGAVHVGIVMLLHATGPVRIRETEQLSGRFVTLDELDELVRSGANLETWSSLLVPELGRLVPQLVGA
jgi:predicted NUDIX family phosphoesterase